MGSYLVTGGAGFIGSHISERLLGSGHEVTVVDNLHTGRMENLSFASGNRNLKFVRADCESLPEPEGKLDGIYHVGVYSSTPMYKENPRLLSAAAAGFVNIFELAKKNSCKVVFASTSSLYNGQEPPHREGMPVLPLDFYTEGRIFAERVGEVYRAFYGVKFAGMRFFAVYGPREEWKRNYANLVSQFIWSISKGEQPVVYGDGLQTRDFTYVSDVVDACLLAMEKEGLAGPVNVGTGKSTRILDLIGMINKAMGRELAPKLIENPVKNYVACTQADISKISSFGYLPKVELKEGIGKCVEYYSKISLP